jgi:hypothetical protein
MVDGKQWRYDKHLSARCPLAVAVSVLSMVEVGDEASSPSYKGLLESPRVDLHKAINRHCGTYVITTYSMHQSVPRLAYFAN